MSRRQGRESRVEPPGPGASDRLAKSDCAVSVCIVTFNSSDDLPDCFESIAQLEHRPLEVVVVDCASADGSADVAIESGRRAESAGIPVRVIALAENLGFSGGMNRAISESHLPYVLALNADARPHPDFVSRLVDSAERLKGQQTAAVTGRLIRPGPAGKRRLDACGMYLVPTWRHLDRGSNEVDRGQLRQRERVFGATGAATLYRRRALEDVVLENGQIFDEWFHSYREDAELCFRFHARGWQVVYEPTAVAEHRRRVLPRGRSSLPAEINYHSLKNRYLLRLYHQTAGNLWRTLVPTLFRDLLAFGYVLVAERTSLPAYSWLWRNRRRILDRRRFLRARRTAPSEAVEIWFRRRQLPLKPP